MTTLHDPDPDPVTVQSLARKSHVAAVFLVRTDSAGTSSIIEGECSGILSTLSHTANTLAMIMPTAPVIRVEVDDTIIRLQRDGDLALVVVLAAASAISKSLPRMMRGILRRYKERRYAAEAKAIGDALAADGMAP